MIIDYEGAWQWMKSCHAQIEGEWRRFSYTNIEHAWLKSQFCDMRYMRDTQICGNFAELNQRVFDLCGEGGHTLLPDPAEDPAPCRRLLHALLMATYGLSTRQVDFKRLNDAYRVVYPKKRGHHGRRNNKMKE